jgi:hypothetical protein
MSATLSDAQAVGIRLAGDVNRLTADDPQHRDATGWLILAFAAAELFGEEAAKHVVMAGRLAARSPEQRAADARKIQQVVDVFAVAEAQP